MAKRYSVYPKTMATWRAHVSIANRRAGPKVLHSTVLAVKEEAVV